MGQINLLAVASQQAQWLSLRQSAISQNIANANTPGFKALDVEPFEKTLEQTALNAASNGATGSIQQAALSKEDKWHVAPSGNSVSLEKELIKADEVNRAYALNTSIVKAFNRMLMMSVK
ncbi:flagellar basal body rod protein FlgB [soil metagenome]